MICEYANKLIDNLPTKPDKPTRIDLVLDGGLFNGSYLVGALCFLKEMERRNYVKIERISGCSIGSIVGLLYCIDSLDMTEPLYTILYKNIQSTRDFSILKEIRALLGNKLTDDTLQHVNKRLYVTYNNIQKRTKQVKHTYNSVDELINTIIKSCFMPGAIDGNLLYKEKYMDGIFPHIFEPKKGRRILHLDLLGYDKIYNIACAKNERTNFHRILSGLLDIHTFYVKQSNTSMCSYIDNWGIYHTGRNYCRRFIDCIIIYLIYFTVFVKNRIPNCITNNITSKIASKLLYETYKILVETYIV
jgi:hypothetical protein